MFKLGSFFQDIIRDGEFSQTQFANAESSMSLCFVGREQFLHQANENPNISCVVVTPSLIDKVDVSKGIAVSEFPEKLFYELHNELYKLHDMKPNIEFYKDDTAFIHPTACVSDKTYIGANVHIGAGVIIEDYTHISKHVRIESGAIVGSSGHYYKHYDGVLFRVEHAGGVWLEEGVQILSGAIVSKSLHTDFTRIGKDTVVSIQAHVGHGCKVGKRCTLTGNVQVSGFTNIGDDVWVGPSATIGNLLTIGNNVRIETGSVVVKSIADGDRVSGNFAWNHRKNIRDYSSKLRG